MPLYFFESEDDIKILRGIVDREKRQVANARNRPYFEQQNQSPPAHVALTPAAGIPALVSLVPGSADCGIYQVTDSGLDSIGASQTVYNLSLSTVSGSAFVPIVQDAFGRWLVAAGGSGFPTCSAVTVQETDLRCEGELLNLYRRTVTLTPVAGCIQRSVGAYDFIKTVACCDQSCLEHTTGTGTGHGDCPCLTPETSCAVLTNLSGCSCLDRHNLQLEHFDSLNQWSSPLTNVGCPVQVSGALYCIDGRYLFKLYVSDGFGGSVDIGGADMTVIACSPFHLRGTVTITNTSAFGPSLPCSNGSTVQVDIYGGACAGATGTGTGTSGGGGGGAIEINGVGSASSGGAAVSSLTLNVTVEAGILEVNVNVTGGLPAVSYTGSAMTNTQNTSVTALGLTLSTTKWRIVVGAGSGNIVVAVPLCAVQMNAVNVIGVTALDVAAATSGIASNPDTGTTGTSAAANEAVTAAFGLLQPSTPTPAWAGSPTFIAGGQDVLDTVGGVTVLLTEGRYIASAVGTFEAALDASVTAAGWNGYVESNQ